MVNIINQIFIKPKSIQKPNRPNKIRECGGLCHCPTCCQCCCPLKIWPGSGKLSGNRSSTLRSRKSTVSANRSLCGVPHHTCSVPCEPCLQDLWSWKTLHRKWHFSSLTVSDLQWSFLNWSQSSLLNFYWVQSPWREATLANKPTPSIVQWWIHRATHTISPIYSFHRFTFSVCSQMPLWHCLPWSSGSCGCNLAHLCCQ